MIVALTVCAWCNQYTINTWLAYGGKPADFPYWGGALIAVCPIIGQLALPGAVVTWIIMMFLS